MRKKKESHARAPKRKMNKKKSSRWKRRYRVDLDLATFFGTDGMQWTFSGFDSTKGYPGEGPETVGKDFVTPLKARAAIPGSGAVGTKMRAERQQGIAR